MRAVHCLTVSAGAARPDHSLLAHKVHRAGSGRVLGSGFGGGGLPSHAQTSVAGSAVAKVEVDQSLVRNPCLLSQVLEVGNRGFIKPDRNPLLQAPGVRVLPSFRKIVFLPHGLHLRPYASRSFLLAFRAEINRMTSCASR